MNLLLAVLLAATPMTNQDVITLTAAGLAPDVIITQLTHTTTRFQTDVAALVHLKEAHVDDRVLLAMLHASPAASPTLPPVRFGGVLIDLPGIRTYEGTLTIGPSGIAYDATGFGRIETTWERVRSVCFERAFYGSLFVRTEGAWQGSAAADAQGPVVLFKCGPSVLQPAYNYLKQQRPTLPDDCSSAGKDV